MAYPLTHENALQVVLKAGRILLESGSEIYRVEQTMGYLARSLQLKQFEAYVISNGIMASATNPNGQQEALILTVYDQQTNLGKLEAVNTLSRQLVQKEHIVLADVSERLDQIDRMTQPSFPAHLLTYFIGAGSFSLALGSSLSDALAAALTGLFLGLVLRLLKPFIHTGFLLTIIGSSAATLSVNMLHLLGLGEHRSLILLGALMMLVPGAIFTNAVRELSQNNFTTGVSLLMSSLLICSSISAGVVIMTSVLPFASTLTQYFPDATAEPLMLFLRTLMAGLGTVAFAVLYRVPRFYYKDLGILGSLSWFFYLILDYSFHIDGLAVFLPCLLIAILSRFLAARRKCPITIFLATSMVPLIPGLSLYRSVYFLLTGSEKLAAEHLRSCFITAFMIALAISIAQQIPKRFFHRT